MPLWLIHLFAVARKELLQTVKDRRMVGLLIIAPTLQLGVFGWAVDFDVDRVPTLVVDHDHTAKSRGLIAGLFADGTLVSRGETESDAEALRRVDRGEVSAVLFIARGFALARERGDSGQVQIVVDGTDPNRGAVAAAAVTRFARAEAVAKQEITAQPPPGSGAPPRVRPATVRLLPRVLYNPRLETSTYIVPGISALLLLIVSVIITAMGLARERETGTLEQILVTPILPSMLMVGKLLPFVAIGLFDFLLVLFVATYAFQVPINGPLWVAFAGTAIYLTCSLGIGLLISTFSRTQQQAFIGGFLFMLPALLLSGVMTPLWGIPWWMAPLTRINPVKYYVEIVRGVLLRGAGFEDLVTHFAMLAVMAVVVIAIASWRFKRSLA